MYMKMDILLKKMSINIAVQIVSNVSFKENVFTNFTFINIHKVLRETYVYNLTWTCVL